MTYIIVRVDESTNDHIPSSKTPPPSQSGVIGSYKTYEAALVNLKQLETHNPGITYSIIEVTK